jgi:RluA family pseudouridine synthase
MNSPSPELIEGCDERYNRHYEIKILYHDERFLIVNKPFNLRVDGPTDKSKTLESHLQQAFPHKKLFLLHQLDYSTSGIHCWGLTKKAAKAIGKLFQRRKIEKEYRALVNGHILKKELWIDAPIEQVSGTQKVSVNTVNGKPSLTYVKVLAHGRLNSKPVTHVELHPKTGRKHQLRAHLASIGHPILGDTYYDPNLTLQEFEKLNHRTHLHARLIQIPLESELIKVVTEDPFSFMYEQL